MPDMELHRRYPHSRTEDITDAYMRGYEAGYTYAKRESLDEMQQLRECLRAILDGGETPEQARDAHSRG